MLAALPLLSLPVAAYIILVFVGDSGQSAMAHARLTETLFQLGGEGGWGVTGADLLVGMALMVMVVELLKSPPGRDVAVANHILTILLFIGCLAALLMFPPFATSTFLLITLMVLLDVVAGFILTFSPPGEEGL